MAARFWVDPDRVTASAYLERPVEKLGGIDRWLIATIASQRSRRRKRRPPPDALPAAMNALAPTLQRLPDRALAHRAALVRPRLLRQGFTPALLTEAFSLASEATRREIGLMHRPVQIEGARLLLDGALLEMATGEGKTITAMLAAATAALAGVRVHVITVNDYLAERDHAELGPIYRRLGLSAGLVVNGLAPAERRAAYGADVVYVNNKEVCFDYLRDRLALGPRRSRARARLLAVVGDAGSSAAVPEMILRGLDFAIVDEADSVLIDEARTPLIISSESARPERLDAYRPALDVAATLEPGIDFMIAPRDRNIRLLPSGRARVAAAMADLDGRTWTDRRAREDRVVQALCAMHLYHRDQHYIVAEDAVQIVDEFTGRVMPDRSWEAGLHQMIEVKEGLDMSGRRTTIARITYQRFFRRYRQLAGMTGTGIEIAGEVEADFGLTTRPVPTHRPIRREFLGTRVFATQARKWRAVVDAAATLVAVGRPVLIGVRSIEASEMLSRQLDDRRLPHTVLNARQEKEEAAIVAEAGRAATITVATNMAGRGTDIKLAPGVADAGGLHVILTEFHESSRIDRQLYGRAGRQGDPGSCEAIVALDDDLFRRYVPRLGALARWLPRPGGTLPERVARGLRWLAQRRAERINASTRRLVMKHDTDSERSLAFAGRSE